MPDTLITFFLRADENYFGGAMRYVKKENTEIVCDSIGFTSLSNGKRGSTQCPLRKNIII